MEAEATEYTAEEAALGQQAIDNNNLLDVLKVISEANGVDETAVAVAWLLAHPARIMPVMGTNSLDRIGKISDALKVKMDRETWFELYTAALGNEVP